MFGGGLLPRYLGTCTLYDIECMYIWGMGWKWFLYNPRIFCSIICVLWFSGRVKNFEINSAMMNGCNVKYTTPTNHGKRTIIQPLYIHEYMYNFDYAGLSISLVGMLKEGYGCITYIYNTLSLILVYTQ